MLGKALRERRKEDFKISPIMGSREGFTQGVREPRKLIGKLCLRILG